VMASSLPRGEAIIAEGHVAAALPIVLIGSSLSTNETAEDKPGPDLRIG